MEQALSPTPLPLAGLLCREYGLQLPAGTRQQECSRGFPVGIIWAGMFSWVSCWNSMKSPFILPAVCPWSLWGVEPRGIPKPSPLGLPTASRHLISAETWSGQCATASAARRRGPSHSHSQLAAGNREYLWGGGAGQPRAKEGGRMGWWSGEVIVPGPGIQLLTRWLSKAPRL